MACMQKGTFATRATSRRACVRVEASVRAERSAQIATATVAAAALLASPAFAGVQLAQPTLKKAFIDESPEKVREAPKPITPSAGFSFPSFGAPSTKSEAAPAKVEKKEEKKDEAPIADGLDPRSIALPASIAFVGGLAFAASKVDDEFDDFLKGTLIKDSNLGQSGLGYEAVIKSTYGGIYGEPTAGTKRVSAGTKKVKAAKKK